MTVGLIIILLVTFITSSIIKGWTGFGTNLIAMPLLISFLGYSLADGVTIVISVNIFMNIAILVENKKFNINSLKSIWVLVVFGVIFTFIGSYFLKNEDNATTLKIIAGSIIVLTGVYQIIRAKFEIKHFVYEKTMSKYFIPVGIISGIFNGIAGLGGLPVLILLSNSDMEKNKFRTTLVTYFLVMNFVAIISYVIAGNYSAFVFTHISILIIPSVIACMIGVYISRRVSDKAFRNVVIAVLIFMGANLIVNGVYGKNIITFFINML